MPENLDVKQVHLLPLNFLWKHSNIKVLSYLLRLMLILLIMASYFLIWGIKGQKFIHPPQKHRPVVVPTNTTAAKLSSEKNLTDMELLVNIINSKLEYKPRKVPDEKVVIKSNSHLFSVIPRHFLPGIKSPCWYEEFSGDLSTDPYKKNAYESRTQFKPMLERMRTNFQKQLCQRDGKQFRLRCLPFFYIIGQPKCGTTDLFTKLQQHQQLKFFTIKEPHWWSRKYFHSTAVERHQKMNGSKDCMKEKYTLEDYLDLFDLAAQRIQEEISGNSSGNHHIFQPITGEASASTSWDFIEISCIQEDTESPFLVLDLIHALQPDAKIILILRDPVERLYSEYLYFNKIKSREDFHERVKKSIKLFQHCLSEMSLRSCVYNISYWKSSRVRIPIGMYIVFLQDWLTVFQKEQILIVRLEDYSANLDVELQKIFDFLGLDPLKLHAAESWRKQRVNTRRVKDRALGPMHPATRDLLREFYQPFNRKLSSVLDNEAFLWSTT